MDDTAPAVTLLACAPNRPIGFESRPGTGHAMPVGVAVGTTSMSMAAPALKTKSISEAHHECDNSPFPLFQIPDGWQQVWLGDRVSNIRGVGKSVSTGRFGVRVVDGGGAGGEACASGVATVVKALPVQLYVSSVGGDRKTTRDCRYAMDFLLSKRVPHAIHDLSAKPELRQVLATWGTNAMCIHAHGALSSH